MNRRPSVDYARLSTMPRANTEARGYLDRYQMAIERARLEKELKTLETRQVEIQKRLQQLALSLGSPNTIQELTLDTPSTIVSTPVQSSTSSDSYQTFVLEF